MAADLTPMAADAPAPGDGSAQPGPAYRPGPWPGEDNGPARRQEAAGHAGLDLSRGPLTATSRTDPIVNMVVTRDPGELYLLRSWPGDDAAAFVERIDPVTLATVDGPVELPGGPPWPGSIAAHANGSLYVVFGNHAHRLGADLAVEASTELPRPLPYNGFVLLPDGHLVTKDFAGSRPGHPVAPDERRSCQLVVLEPEHLTVVDTCTLSEPSIARLSADGPTVWVVGDTSLLRVGWDGRRLAVDGEFHARYRTQPGQTYGWDCVLAGGAAWFLDDGEGSERFNGSLRGLGVSEAPLHLVRVDLGSAEVTLAEVCGEPGGLIANPPVVDVRRGVAVAYDTGNGAMRAFTLEADGTLAPRWDRAQDHGSHLLLFPDSGQLVTGDFDAERGTDQAVLLDIDTGTELGRVDTGSPFQSVVFPALGFDDDVYACTLSTVTRLTT